MGDRHPVVHYGGDRHLFLKILLFGIIFLKFCFFKYKNENSANTAGLHRRPKRTNANAEAHYTHSCGHSISALLRWPCYSCHLPLGSCIVVELFGFGLCYSHRTLRQLDVTANNSIRNIQEKHLQHRKPSFATSKNIEKI